MKRRAPLVSEVVVAVTRPFTKAPAASRDHPHEKETVR
jgi:hypothetical protein